MGVLSVVDVVVGDSVEISPPEVACKQAVVTGYSAHWSEWFQRWLSMSNRTKSHPSFMRFVTPSERTPLPEGWRRAEEAITALDEKAANCGEEIWEKML